MTDGGKLIASDEAWDDYPRVGWIFDGEGGGTLGDEEMMRTSPPPVPDESEGHWIATYAVAQAFPDADVTSCYGFAFDSMTQARKALAVAKRAIADAKLNRVPEPWEALALAAGWTPPKAKR